MLETSGPHLDEAESDPGAWPLDRHYVFGSLFIDHVAKRYRAQTVPDWMARRAGSFRSIVSRGAGVGELFGGNSLSEEWKAWIVAERDDAMRLRDQLRASAPGLAETTRVCDIAHFTAFPRASPDGSRIAFLGTDEGRKPLGLYVADLQTCDARRIARVNSPHAFSWTRDGRSIVFSQLELVDTARVLGDLYRIDVDSGRCDAPHARCAARLAGRSPERPDDRGCAVRTRAKPSRDGRHRVGHGDWTDGVR